MLHVKETERLHLYFVAERMQAKILPCTRIGTTGASKVNLLATPSAREGNRSPLSLEALAAVADVKTCEVVCAFGFVFHSPKRKMRGDICLLFVLLAAVADVKTCEVVCVFYLPSRYFPRETLSDFQLVEAHRLKRVLSSCCFIFHHKLH